MENLPAQAQAPMGGQIHIGGFTERGVLSAVGRDQIFRLGIGTTIEVEFFVLEDQVTSEQTSEVLMTLGYMAAIEEGVPQMCAYVASAINIIMPMTTDFLAFFTEINWKVKLVQAPSGILDDLQPSVDWWKTMTFFMQLVMLLFKNVSDANYLEFMNKRIVAARAFLSAPEDLESKVWLSVGRAQTVRRVLGGSHKLRSGVLSRLLGGRAMSNIFGQLCTYICGILAWTEMSYLTFIFDELVITNSPVLAAPEVASEVRQLTFALVSVLTSPYPQYYKIMTPPAQQKYTERNRFPILIAVATGLKKERIPSARNFNTGMSMEDPIIKNLMALHVRRLTPPSQLITSSVEWLRGETALTGGMEALLRNRNWEA